MPCSGSSPKEYGADIHPLLNPLLEISSDEDEASMPQAPEAAKRKEPPGPSPALPTIRKRSRKSSIAWPKSRSRTTPDTSVEKKAAMPRKRVKRPPVPSFMFQPPAPPLAADLAGKETASVQDVDVFVTLAGRPGKGGSTTKLTTIDELERMVPVSFVPNVVPEPFADHLLQVFLEEAKSWHKPKRWLYEREIESHRVESGFRFNDFGSAVSSSSGFSQRWERAGFGDDLRHLRGQVATAVQRARNQLRQRWRQRGADVSVDTPLNKHELAQETVALASRGQRLSAQSVEWLVRYAQSYATKSWRWEPNFVVANLYKDQDDFLGAHSDPVDVIGPFAIIASLTFGASRQFRMKPTGTVRSAEGRITSFSIRLPHNSLLVCWEGFQEFWRHEVPKDNGLKIHAIGGRSRLNFTFRHSVGSVSARRPFCHCGRKADLKPVLKEASKNRGRYFWSCRNPRVKKGVYRTCDFFKWDDELIKEPPPRRGAPAPAPDAASRVIEVPKTT